MMATNTTNNIVVAADDANDGTGSGWHGKYK
jgi:hypothetical protein